MTTALLITPDGEMTQVTAGDYTSIRDFVGGIIDCVTSREMNIVGYVHDEGLLIGLEANVIASGMFGRPLVGNCLVFGMLNESGEYDGENHDIPPVFLVDEFHEYCATVNADPNVRSMVESAVSEAIENPITITAITDEEWDKLFTEGE